MTVIHSPRRWLRVLSRCNNPARLALCGLIPAQVLQSNNIRPLPAGYPGLIICFIKSFQLSVCWALLLQLLPLSNFCQFGPPFCVLPFLVSYISTSLTNQIMKQSNIKFYALLAFAVVAVVAVSVALLGGYGLLLDCVLFGAFSALAD